MKENERTSKREGGNLNPTKGLVEVMPIEWFGSLAGGRIEVRSDSGRDMIMRING